MGAQGPRGVGAERMARNLPSREKARHLTSVPGLWFDEAAEMAGSGTFL